jgi:hypothetical protein
VKRTVCSQCWECSSRAASSCCSRTGRPPGQSRERRHRGFEHRTWRRKTSNTIEELPVKIVPILPVPQSPDNPWTPSDHQFGREDTQGQNWTDPPGTHPPVQFHIKCLSIEDFFKSFCDQFYFHLTLIKYGSAVRCTSASGSTKIALPVTGYALGCPYLHTFRS